MCGIAGIYLKNPADTYLRPQEIEDIVDCLHLGIESRGTHASGIAVQTVEGKMHLEKSDMTASKFIFWRTDIPENPRAILLHTRLHTKGKPENLLNNHPVQYNNIFMTHNGHISNDDELFKTEELERYAEVDSEIISALLHKYSLHDPKKALEMMQGGFAIAALDENQPGKLLLAKGQTSPLCFLETSGMWIWASESNVVRNAMEVVLGYDTKPADIKHLSFGEYILIENENHRKVDFQPYTKTYTSKAPTTSYLGQTNTYYGKNAYSPENDQCDECFRYFDRWKMNRIGFNYYCDQCEKKLYDIDQEGMRIPKDKKLSRKEKKRLRKEQQRRFLEESKKAEASEQKKLASPKLVNVSELEIGDVLDEEHWVVCELVAEYFGTKKDFVNMVLFSEDVQYEDDPILSSIHMEFTDKYEEILEDIREDTDVILNQITDSRTRNFPVGF